MGCLEELHHFSSKEIDDVIRDIKQEYDMPVEINGPGASDITSDNSEIKEADSDLRKMDDRLIKMESSISSVLDLLKKVLSSSNVKKNPGKKSSGTVKFNTHPYAK